MLRVAASLVVLVLAGTLSGCSGSASSKDQASGQSASIPSKQGSPSAANSGTSGPISNQTSRVAPLGRHSVKVSDRYPDAKTEGTAPGYVDITSGAVEDLGRDVRLVLSVHDNLPEAMPDDTTYLIVSWNLEGSRTHPSRGFSLQATRKGWSIQAGGNEGVVRYPGTFTVAGKSIEIRFPWSFLGGRRGFAWSASSSWFANSGKKPSSSVDTTNGTFKTSPSRG